MEQAETSKVKSRDALLQTSIIFLFHSPLGIWRWLTHPFTQPIPVILYQSNIRLEQYNLFLISTLSLFFSKKKKKNYNNINPESMYCTAFKLLSSTTATIPYVLLPSPTPCTLHIMQWRTCIRSRQHPIVSQVIPYARSHWS